MRAFSLDTLAGFGKGTCVAAYSSTSGTKPHHLGPFVPNSQIGKILAVAIH